MTETNRKNTALLLLTVAALSFLAYINTVAKPFVFDDFPFILDEPKHRSLANIPSFFMEDQHLLYRPLRSTAYTVAYALFDYSPVAYRFIAISVHAAASVLFTGIALEAGAGLAVAAVAGAVFAIHPVHADRIAFTTSSFDSIGLIFGFASLMLLMKYRRLGKKHDLIFGLTLLAIGLLGSEECATIPLLFAAWVWIDDTIPWQKRNLKPFLLGMIVFAAYLTLRTAVLGQISRVAGTPPPPLLARIATESTVIWHEAAKIIFPFSLRPAYWTGIRESLLAPAAIAGLAALALCLIWLIRKRGSSSLAAFGAAWFFISLIPFSNIIPIDTYMAERYLYSPVGGFALIGAGLVRESGLLSGISRKRTSATIALLLICAAMLLFSVWHRGWAWSDELRLWKDAYSKDDKAGLILINYGNQIKLRGLPEDPCPIFERSVKYNPERYEAYVGLGECEARRGETEAALAHFKLALAKAPQPKGALEGLSQLYAQMGDLEKSFKAAQELLRIDPGSLVGRYVMGYILLRLHRFDEAERELKAVANATGDVRGLAAGARKLLEDMNRSPSP